MARLDLVNTFKKRTRHPFRPRASDIIEALFPDFEPFKTPGQSLLVVPAVFWEKTSL